MDITAKFIKRMYENESLEKKLESNRDFERELEKHSELPSNNCLISFESIRVCRTDAIERFRTDQTTEDDLPEIAAFEKYSVVFPNGRSKQLLG